MASLTGPPSAGSPWPVGALAALVALLTAMVLELVRSSGPLLDLVYSRGGVVPVVRATLLTYAAPGPLAVLLLTVHRRSRVRSWPALRSGVVLLAALRLLVQSLDGELRFVVGLATVAAGILALTLAVAVLADRPGGGQTAAAAVSSGAAGAVGLQLSLGTWDAYWQHTLLGWSVSVAVAVGAVALVLVASRHPGPERLRPVTRLWVLGPFLALAATMLANPAFAAAQSGVPLAVAGTVHALGLLGAGRLTARLRSGTGTRRFKGAASLGRAVSPVLLALLTLAALGLRGLGGAGAGGSGEGGRGAAAVVLLAVLGAQLLAVRTLAAALEPSERAAATELAVLPMALSSLLVGVLTIGWILTYQIDYDVPLGFPHQLVLAAAAGTLGLAGLRHGHRTHARPVAGARRSPGGRLLWAGPAALVLIGAVVAGSVWLSRTDGSATPEQAPGCGTVLTWNLHYGVTPQGSVDPEAVARTIEQQNPDVVLLQEVSRGWVQGGGVDLATWLANRLHRRFVFAPAADGEFGNVILSRGTPTEVRVQQLPYGTGPQHRSAVTARVRVGLGSLLVTSVHLQQRAANTPTRLVELRALLAPMGTGAGPARLIGGDLNAGPSSPELALVRSSGFVSALDTAGDPRALTSPGIRPVRRIDWVLGRGVAFRSARVLPEARTSDHLPVVATVRP